MTKGLKVQAQEIKGDLNYIQIMNSWLLVLKHAQVSGLGKTKYDKKLKNKHPTVTCMQYLLFLGNSAVMWNSRHMKED